MGKILKLIGQRLAIGLLVLWIVSLIIFAGLEFLPGDLAQEILGQSATPESLAAFRKELGLDQPMHTISAKLFNLTDSPYYHMLSSNIMVGVAFIKYYGGGKK